MICFASTIIIVLATYKLTIIVIIVSYTIDLQSRGTNFWDILYLHTNYFESSSIHVTFHDQITMLFCKSCHIPFRKIKYCSAIYPQLTNSHANTPLSQSELNNVYLSV